MDLTDDLEPVADPMWEMIVDHPIDVASGPASAKTYQRVGGSERW